MATTRRAAGPDLARHSYELFGLRIDSALTLPGVEPSSSSAPPDYILRRSTVALTDASAIPHASIVQPIASDPERHDGVVIARSGAEHIFLYADGTGFLVDDEKGEITTWWGSRSSLPDMFTYLGGPVLAYIVRARGVLALHASGVADERGALLFAGAAGAGKSTTATALVKRGMRAVTDDVAAIDEHARVHSGIPALRLWSDSAAALYGSEDALPALTPNWEKRRADVAQSFERGVTPVRAIFVLQPRGGTAPQCERVYGHAAVAALLPHTSMTDFIPHHVRLRELDQLASLVSSVPVFQLTLPASFASFDELATLLER